MIAKREVSQMKNLLLISALALVGCLDLTGIQDQVDRLIAPEVGFVNCTPATLEIAVSERGSCDVFNPDSTQLDPFLVEWSSSIPSAITINTRGAVHAENFISNNVVITADGGNASSEFFIMETF